MTIQWTVVAGFLYGEIIFIILLLLPVISPRVWKSIFQSWICQAFAEKANVYFSIFIAILILFFLDSIREMRKYSGSLEAEHIALDADLQLRLKLFRSQRNYYIAGFALFLWLIIRRLVILILSQATMLSEIEVSMREAQTMTSRAESLERQVQRQGDGMHSEAAENCGNSKIEALKLELSELSHVYTSVTQELEQTKIELTSLKQKTNSIAIEYESLLQEHCMLEGKYNQLVGCGDKKDN